MVEAEAKRYGVSFIAAPLENPNFLPCVRSLVDSRRQVQRPMRRWPRKPVPGVVEVDAAAGRAQLVDMSYGGVRLVFDQPREIPTTFDIMLPPLGVTVTVQSCDTGAVAVRQVETAKEWLSLTEAAELAGVTMDVLRYHIGKGELAIYKRDESHRNRYVNRDELNRFLATFSYAPRSVREDVQTRVEVQYSPIFSGVQSSLM